MTKDILGITYQSLFDHSFTVMANGINDLIIFSPSGRSKPTVIYKMISISDIGIHGGEKVAVKIEHMPTVFDGRVYLVPAFVLEAIHKLYPELVHHFNAPGKQIRGANGKILYADGLYKIRKIKPH